MAGYEDTRQKIISTLMGRPVGTEIQPENHQDYALNMLDYIRSLELIATSTLIGVAESNTTPVQPNSSRVCYIAGVAQNQTVVFENFIDENGNPISVTTGDMEGFFIILLWNTQYWSAQTFSTNIISQSESATFYYRYNIRKTYASIALMNADVSSPIGTDGKYIKVGDIVTVVNSTTPSENGIYSYEGATDGWKYQSSFNFQLSQTTGSDPNVAMSQLAVSTELSYINTLIDKKKTENSTPTAVWRFLNFANNLGEVWVYFDVPDNTSSFIWYDGNTYKGGIAAKKWVKIDTTNVSKFRVYLKTSTNCQVTLKVIKQSVIQDFLKSYCDDTALSISDARIDNALNSVLSIDQNKTQLSTDTYFNFSFSGNFKKGTKITILLTSSDNSDVFQVATLYKANGIWKSFVNAVTFNGSLVTNIIPEDCTNIVLQKNPYQKTNDFTYHVVCNVYNGVNNVIGNLYDIIIYNASVSSNANNINSQNIQANIESIGLPIRLHGSLRNGTGVFVKGTGIINPLNVTCRIHMYPGDIIHAKWSAAYWTPASFEDMNGNVTVVSSLTGYNGEGEYTAVSEGYFMVWSASGVVDCWKTNIINKNETNWKHSVDSSLESILTNVETIQADLDDVQFSLSKIDSTLTEKIIIAENQITNYSGSYTNARPFNILLTDVIITKGILPSNILFSFSVENRTLTSGFIEWVDENGVIHDDSISSVLKSQEGNLYNYEFPLISKPGAVIYRVLIQVSGTASPSTPHIFTLKEVSYQDYIDVKQLKNLSPDTVVNYIRNGYNFMNHIVVKKDGTGDFTTIQDAINSITDASPAKQYDIQVWDDYEITDLTELFLVGSPNQKNTNVNPTSSVALVITKNWVNIRGMKGGGNILYIESPSDLSSASFQNIQTIYPMGNVIIDNFYVGIKGGRYAIHQESGGSKNHPDYHAHTIYMNLIIEHKGNESYANGNGWTSTMAQANGTTSGLKQTYINCKWISANNIPFYAHTNSDFDEPNEQTMINCSMICTKPGVKISEITSYWGDIGSGQKSVMKFIGCSIPRFNAGGYGGTRGTETTNELRVKYGYNGGSIFQGYSNAPMAVSLGSKPVLTFAAVNNNIPVKVIGGTAYDLIWGKTWKTIKESLTNKCFTFGSIRMSEAQAWASNSQVFCLPFYLGNCVSSPKTLILEVGEQQYTITFNKNYMTSDGSSYDWSTIPAVSNSQVIADINSSNPTVFQAYFNSPLSEVFTFEDCMELGINVDSVAWTSGKCLVRSLLGHQNWKLSQDGDMVEGIAGEFLAPSVANVGDNPCGKILYPTKSYFPISLFGLSGVTAGNLYKAGADGTLVITTNRSEASFVAVDSGYLIGIRR